MDNFDKVNYKTKVFLILIVNLVAIQRSRPGELAFMLIIPTFGGSPFEPSPLIGIAEIQKLFAEDGLPGIGSTGPSQSDLIPPSLSSRLLSASTGSVTEVGVRIL